jgi:hypothetical protein
MTLPAYSRALLLTLLSSQALARAEGVCLDRHEAALPADAYLVPVDRADDLQSELDRHQRIRLIPAADYRRFGALRVTSHQAIYGAAETRIGRIIVQPGTHDAVLSGVAAEAIEFPPSAIATYHNCFERAVSRLHGAAPLRLA